jgi:hypothetical protein
MAGRSLTAKDLKDREKRTEGEIVHGRHGIAGKNAA